MENITLTREEVLAIVQEALTQQHSADLEAREAALTQQQQALSAREKQDRALQLLRDRGWISYYLEPVWHDQRWTITERGMTALEGM